MDRSVTPKILYGPKLLQSEHNWMHYYDILNTNTKTITKIIKKKWKSKYDH